MEGNSSCLDFKLCLVCQAVKAEALVENPRSSYKALLNAVRCRAEYGEIKYAEIWSNLKEVSPEELTAKAGTWHRKCYQEVTHSGMLKRSRERYEKEVTIGTGKRKKQEGYDVSSNQLTRSQTAPYNKDVWVFCEKGSRYRETLSTVRTNSAGKSLHDAIEISGNEKLRVKLSTSIDLSDAHAIDIKYHKRCWGNNVSTVLRQSQSKTGASSGDNQIAAEIAAKIEFLTATEVALRNGKILKMSDLQGAYRSILEENGVESMRCNRKVLKELIKTEIDEVQFHRPKRVNESDRVTIKGTRDAAVQLSEKVEQQRDMREEMKTLYDAALLLRKCISKTKRWVFEGSLETFSKDNFPEELYCFFRWVINGPNATLSTEDKCQEVHKRAMSLVQSTMSMCLTDRQIGNKKSELLKSAREMPQQVAVGIAIHQAVRSKQLVNLLHGFGLSVEYNRLLRVEAQIESSVLKRMEENNGLFLPPDIVKGRHVFFAIDNVDFAEDTYDGRDTLHGTAMAIYQKSHVGDEIPPIRFGAEETENLRSISDLPASISTLEECQDPPSKLPCPKFPTFALYTEEQTLITLGSKEYAWLLARNLSREQDTISNASVHEEESLHSKIPVWSAYNSLISKVLPVTRVSAPPLVAAPAHEWSTLLTVLKQAQGINVKIVGQHRKTCISLDMGLYLPAKKLQMARDDLNHILLRPGELHIVATDEKTIGVYIENSGIDMAWIESDLYSPATVKQILEGNHIKRAKTAHLITLQAFFILYQEAFLHEHEGECKERLLQMAKELEQACVNGSNEEVAEAHTRMEDALESMDIMTRMAKFDKEHAKNPMYTVFRQYMTMVLEMFMFIRAIRSADWLLHLQALEIFTKYYFAHDRLNYARMIPLYLAEMKSLPETDPDIYREFKDGNWVVNKNPNVPFSGLGVDHGLEHINRSMKVSGGLVGITLNPSARAKFFLIAPELARLARQAKDMAGVTVKVQDRHHNHNTKVLNREEKNILKLKSTISNYTNPFTQTGDELFNLVTKVVVPDDVKRDLCTESSEGRKLFETFITERIQKGSTNLWSKMKKRKLLTWKSTGQKAKVKLNNAIVELQEDRSLFARMMMVCQTRPEINLQEAIGVHEFTVVPRALFAADGTMLHCSNKSTLMTLVEKEAAIVTPSNDLATASLECKKVDIVDGMAVLQSLDKPARITKCVELADHFSVSILQKHCDCDELHLVFDRYDIPLSLKTATRVRRQRDQEPVSYHITDSTHIAKIPMKRLLSHTKTKMEMTEYLARKVLERSEQEGRNVVVAWSNECNATYRDVSRLSSCQEEADTKMILHAMDATMHGATEINIFSQDTDVFILLLRRYPELCQNVNFVTGIGQRHRVVELQPIAQALGKTKIAALPALHAMSGADITGSFANKGKLTWWKVFKNADEETIASLANLGTREPPTTSTMDAIEKLVCQVYVPGTTIDKVKDLRWILFRKKQAQSERLPPTQAALRHAIMRANYQALIWNMDNVANPELPSPEAFGWKLEGNAWVPVMTPLLPAPKAVIELVKCGCTTSRCSSNRCNCRKAQLSCTDLCCCCANDDSCENRRENQTVHDIDYEIDEEEN